MTIIENLKQFGILVIRTIGLRGAAFFRFLAAVDAEKMVGPGSAVAGPGPQKT